MTMVERVGLAAYNAAENGFRSFDREKDDIQDYLREKIAFIGRAAVQSMREPTPEMLKSGGLSMCNHGGGWDGPGTCWDWMIEAALSEQEGVAEGLPAEGRTPISAALKEKE